MRYGRSGGSTIILMLIFMLLFTNLLKLLLLEGVCGMFLGSYCLLGQFQKLIIELRDLLDVRVID